MSGFRLAVEEIDEVPMKVASGVLLATFPSLRRVFLLFCSIAFGSGYRTESLLALASSFRQNISHCYLLFKIPLNLHGNLVNGSYLLWPKRPVIHSSV